LGTLYLIMPEKLHPFWYSPLLPFFFFLSAIAVGLAMTIFESSMSAKYFGRQLELPILQELGRVLLVVLSVIAILRFEDLLHRGVLPLMLRPSYEMYLFWLEVVLSLIAPLILLSRKTIRQTAGGLYLCSVLVVLGFITNRLNVSITGMETSAGLHYVPRWTEISVTGAIIAAGFALFGVAVKYLPIFPAEEHGAAVTLPVAAVAGKAQVPALENAGD
jgi:Ni/Fe-hydrogenase subunit HybB-like protein